MAAEVDAFVRAMWARFESEKIRAVCPRNYDVPVGEGDYDLVVDPADLRRAGRIIASVADQAGWRALFRETVANHHHLGFWRERPDNAEGPLGLHLDLQDALGRKGFLYAAAAPFVADSQMIDGVRVPRPEARALALALHAILDKGTLRDDYRKALQRDTVPGLERFSESVLSPRAARMVCDWIRSGAAEAEIGRLAKALRSNLTRSHLQNRVRPALVRLGRWSRWFGRRQGVLIAFLGPDGAGKSTVLDAVRRLAPRGPFPVQAVYMGKRDTFLPTSRLIRLLYRHRQTPGAEPEGPSRSGGSGKLLFRLKDVAGLVNWTLEQWARHLVQVRPILQQGGFVLADRYAFDLGSRAAGSLAHRPLFRRLLPRLFPVPDRTYLLWEDPEVLFARKGELPPDVAARQIERLRQIVRHVPGSREVRTDRPAEVIAAEIAHEVAALMESRCRA